MSRKYDEYLQEHISNVERAFLWLVDHNIIDEADVPPNAIYHHDESKFSKDEYDAYDKYFFKDKEAAKEEFEKAWLHHIRNNPHHWNYWVVVDAKNEVYPIDMPKRYVIEMLCDHLSFAFKKNDLNEIFEFYCNKKSDMVLTKNTRDLYESYLNKIAAIIKKENA